MSLPLVTCICPTQAVRGSFLPKMIECFERQTYPNKELIIVPDSREQVAELLSQSRCPDAFTPGSVRELEFFNVESLRIFVIAGPKSSLGLKRNFCCEQGRGELIAHFDDDDYSAPTRLAIQVERLEKSGKAVSGLCMMKFTDGQKWWRYMKDVNYPLGTSLVYRRSWWEQNRFPDVQLASDAMVISWARAQHQVDVIPAGDLMLATVHLDKLERQPDVASRRPISSFPISEAIAC